MSTTTPMTRRRLAILLALVLATPAVLALRALTAGLPDFAVSADNAVIELYVRGAAQGALTLGPYSRLGFHHPGPLMFYLLVPFYELAGGRFSGLLLGAVALNAVACAAIVALAWRAAGDAVAAWMSGAVVLFQLFLGPNLLYSVWNPNLSILPFMASIVALAASMAGRPGLLLAAVGFGSLALQSHLGFAPPLAVALVVALVGVGRRALDRAERDRARPAIVAAVASTGVALLLWLPVLYEEAAGRPGNVTRIVEFLRQAGPGHSLTEALRTVGGLVGAPLLLPLGVGAQHVPRPGAPVWAASLALLVLCGWAGVREARRRHLFTASLALLVLAVSAAAVAAVAGIVGAIEPYLVRWMTGLGALALVPILAAFTSRWRDRSEAKVRWWGATLAAVLAGFGVTGAARAPALAVQAARPQFTRIADLARSVEATLEARHVRAVKIGIVHGPAWESAAGVLLRLVKDGWRVGADAAWLDVFGRSLRMENVGAALVFATAEPIPGNLGEPAPEAIARDGRVVVLLVEPRSGDDVRFGFGAPESVLYCVDGLSGPEGRGSFRWSRGPATVLSLPLRPATRYRLAIDVATAAALGGAQEVSIRAGGVELGRFPVGTRRTTLAVELNSTGTAPGTEIQLRYTHTVQPGAVGSRLDQRHLGVRLYSLVATPETRGASAVEAASPPLAAGSAGSVRD